MKIAIKLIVPEKAKDPLNRKESHLCGYRKASENVGVNKKEITKITVRAR
jgi:hypothetical protein